MPDRPDESDWKRYSKMVPVLREKYFENRNRELIGVLNDPDKTPTQRFWDSREVSDGITKVVTDCLGKHSRSYMFLSMLLMLRHGMMTEGDLAGFSHGLQERLRAVGNL